MLSLPNDIIKKALIFVYFIFILYIPRLYVDNKYLGTKEPWLILKLIYTSCALLAPYELYN